jgi:hypothetical protein
VENDVENLSVLLEIFSDSSRQFRSRFLRGDHNSAHETGVNVTFFPYSTTLYQLFVSSEPVKFHKMLEIQGVRNGMLL